MLKEFWKDDSGAVITTEYLILTSVFLVGLIPALVEFRNQCANSLTGISTIISSPIQQTTIPAITIDNTNTATNNMEVNFYLIPSP